MEVEIRTRLGDEGERLVTVIEVLSLANKTPGEKGRELYLEKQREVLGSPVHLVEIDLLRGGEHTDADVSGKAPPEGRSIRLPRFRPSLRAARPASSFMRGNWKIPCPRSPFRCLPGDGEVPLDLAAVFTQRVSTRDPIGTACGTIQRASSRRLLPSERRG